MARQAALAALLCLSAIAVGAASCIPSEPHVDCNFHGLVSSEWSKLSAGELTAAWKAAVAATPAYPAGQFSGKGLVITATKVDMVNVPVLLEVLQSEGFNLPVEIWYSGEVDAALIDVLAASYKKLVIKNVANYASEEDLQKTITSQREHTFQVKPLAIINSEFEEVLFLDADNIPMSNPAALFDSAEYQTAGALFWPDFWQTATENPIWTILGVSPQGWEQESGQMVINKKQAWAALNLAFFLAKDSTFQQMVNGDKEAFRLAFLATGTSFHMIQTPVASAGSMKDGSFCGHTMVQHDVFGEALFLHHNSLKYGADLSWEMMKAVASFESSFTTVPKAQNVIKGAIVSCLDLVGTDVVVTNTPFPAFEKAYTQSVASTDSSLRHASQTEFVSLFTEQRRRLLVANGSATACDPAGAFSNTCFSSDGGYFICCSVPCTAAADPVTGPVCPGTTGPTVAPAGTISFGPFPTGSTCPANPDGSNNPLNPCYLEGGAQFRCCTTPCSNTIQGTCSGQ